MTFLNPTILFGLIAAGVPVMIHLLNLRKLKKVEFSTLAFLKEIQKSKIRRVKLKQWILLALRVLIIILLVTSFARPTLESTSLGGAAPTAKSSIVILLDDTFSMSAVSGNGSLFNQAKQMAANILSESIEGDEFSLVLISNTDSKVKSPVTGKNEFLKMLDETTISQASGTIEDAINQAGAILASSDNLNKHIYLLSDFQKSRLITKAGRSSGVSFVNSSDTELYLFDYSIPRIVNLAVTNFETTNQVFELNKQIGFTASISNFSDVSIENSVASLFINGKREAQRSFNSAPGAVTQISFETTLRQTGLLKIECVLEDDNIINDNTRHLSISIPEEISILILADNFDDTKYLELALSGSGSGNFKISKKRGDLASSIDLNKFDVVFLVGTELINDFANLKSYVASGGRLVVMPGNQSTLVQFQSAMKQLELPPPVGLIRNTGSGESAASFEGIDYRHPIFSGMFEKDTPPEIESPSLNNYFAVITGGQGKSIIDLNTGYSFLSEYRVGAGNVLLFNCAPVLSTGDFPLKGIFSPLLNKAVYYLSSNSDAENKYTAGEDVFVNLSGRTIPQLEIIRPDLTREIINLGSLKSPGYYRYPNTDLSGIYQFLSNNRLIDYSIVNFDPLESDTRHLLEEEFEDFLENQNFEGDLTYIPLDSDINSIIRQTRYGSELWKPFLILAFVIAILEMIISKSSKKDMVALTNNS